MPGPAPCVAAVRVAVRDWLRGHLDLPGNAAADAPAADAPVVLVGCSGGADSLALTAATAFAAPRLGLRVGVVVVDHGLQAGSDRVAERAATVCRQLLRDHRPRGGTDEGFVEVRPVAPTSRTSLGPEAAAREARYTVLTERALAHGARAVLVGHTRDDQAEQVLLGLVRGSGARSLAGIPDSRELAGGVLLGRPLLGIDRAGTEEVCSVLGLTPWIDPHNDDPRYSRVRVRRALRSLAADLGPELAPGLRAGLTRSADLLRDDAEALEEWAETAHRDLVTGTAQSVGVPDVLDLPRAVRNRLWQRLALAAGCPATDLTATHLASVDALVTDWRGQGEVHLPGGLLARREQGRVVIGPRRS